MVAITPAAATPGAGSGKKTGSGQKKAAPAEQEQVDEPAFFTPQLGHAVAGRGGLVRVVQGLGVVPHVIRSGRACRNRYSVMARSFRAVAADSCWS